MSQATLEFGSPDPEIPPYRVKDRVTTDYYPREKSVVRTVIGVDRWRSQTNWRVTTIDDSGRILAIDSAWYKRA